MSTATEFVLEGDRWVIEKKEGAILEYTWPWGVWLAGASDSLAEVLEVTSEGVTVDTHSASGTNVIVWVSGGDASKTKKLAWVSVKIRTVGNREEVRTAYFRITPR